MILCNSLFNKPSCITNALSDFSTIHNRLSVVTDSRNVNLSSVFVALEGEKFDGFDFINDSLCSSVKGIVVREDESRLVKLSEWKNRHPELCILTVSDTTLYLQQVSRLNLNYWIEKFQGVSIAITGSNGKTTNKEMITHILNELYPNQVHSTWKNFNNHIGVPLTLLALEPQHRYLVLELGTNHPGEIEKLCEIASPSSGYITNIGDSHLEFFYNRDNVFVEKSSLYNSCKKHQHDHSVFIINSDDPYLKQLPKDKFCKSVGENRDSDFQLKLTNNSTVIKHGEQEYEIRDPSIIGIHNYRNFAMASCMVFEMTKREMSEIVKAAQSFLPKNNRSELRHIDGKTIFLDAYNANPSSMEFATKSFADYISEQSGDKNALFIVGDMNELGETAANAHRELAHYLEKLRLEVSYKIDIIYIGRYKDDFKEGITNFQGVTLYSDRSDFEKVWDQSAANYSFLFIKASRSLQLESLIGIS